MKQPWNYPATNYTRMLVNQKKGSVERIFFVGYRQN